MEMFNSFKINKNENKRYIDNLYYKIFLENNGSKLNKTNLDIVKNNLMPWYVRASIIAKKNQRIFLRAGLLVYSLTPIAVAAVAFGTLVHHLSGYFFLSEFIILSVILTIVLFADRCKAQKKWTQSRYLTEGIRSAIYLYAAGFRPLPISVPHHLRIAHRPDDWMVRIFDQILSQLPEIQKCSEIDYKSSESFIKNRWITTQIEFQKTKFRQSSLKSRRIELLGKIVFALAVIAAGVHTALYVTGYEFEMEWISVYVVFAAIALPTFGSSLGAIRTHREYSRLAKRSENMSDSLDELLEDFDKIKSLNELKTLVDKTHELMLREAQDWLGLMKFPKVEPL
jgi:hypothetical protein